MTVADVQVSHITHKRVILHKPDAGWSAAAYGQELEAYAAEYGRAPQTVTMHPDTAVALELHDGLADAADSPNAPFLVTSAEYPRQTVTLYY